VGEGKANVGHGGGLAHASLARGDEGDARGGARELGLVVPLEEGQMGIWVLYGLGFWMGGRRMWSWGWWWR